MTQTLGFHMYFPLDLVRLSAALRWVAANPDGSTADQAADTRVNIPVARGFRGWLEHAGLLSLQNDKRKGRVRVTPFGGLTSQWDPDFKDSGTLWLIHYYLSSQHEARSDAWYVLTNNYLYLGRTFTLDQFKAYLAGTLTDQATNHRGLNGDPKIALRGYVDQDGLARLGVLRESGGVYTVSSPNLPDTLILSFMLFDWWDRNFGDTRAIRLSQIVSSDSSLGKVCVADERRVRGFIYALSNLGCVHFSESQYEPVTRLQAPGADALLEQYYRSRQ